MKQAMATTGGPRCPQMTTPRGESDQASLRTVSTYRPITPCRWPTLTATYVDDCARPACLAGSVQWPGRTGRGQGESRAKASDTQSGGIEHKPGHEQEVTDGAC